MALPSFSMAISHLVITTMQFQLECITYGCRKKAIFHGRHLGSDNSAVIMWHKIDMAMPRGKHVWNLLHVVSTSKYKHHWLIFYEVAACASLVQAISQCLASSSWQQIGSRLSQFLWPDAIGTLGRLLPTLLSSLHFTLGSDLPQEAAGMLLFQLLHQNEDSEWYGSDEK